MSLIILYLQALGVYWFFSNILAIGVSTVIKHPSMRDRLKIPQPIQHTVKKEKPSGDTIWQRTKHGTLSVYPITCPFLIRLSPLKVVKCFANEIDVKTS